MQIERRKPLTANVEVAAGKLDGLAYCYESLAGSDIRTAMTNLIPGNPLLIAQGFPMCIHF